ncbi:MAG: cation transporter [Elusimicrobia bacterium]|nr:cation transporter [Elusimicrobiota bacterium]
MKEKIASVGALASAALASVCCLGPIVLIGLGLGGVGLAAGLAKYRLFFLGLTAILLGSAFYMTYRKRKVACADGSCEFRSGSKTMKTVLWVIAILAVGTATFPDWSALFLSKHLAAASANAQTVHLSISGMSCTACALSIERSLKKVHGVESAFVDFEKAEAAVLVEPGTSTDDLLKAVSAAGDYTAKIKN